jgi:hypothetical protein
MMNDAYVTDYDPMATAVWFQKPFEMGSFEMFVAHDEDEYDYYRYGARLAFDFNENFHMAANYVKYDATNWDDDFSTLWGDLIVNFNENIAFKGQYFYQDFDGEDENPTAWKAILQVSQDALKFTDLWIEYAQIDEYFFFANTDPYGWAGSSPAFHSEWNGTYPDWDTTVLNIVAHQKWNDQWWTYVRYIDVDSDSPGDWHSYKGYTASVRYNYTPNLWFELGYDKIDLGNDYRASTYEGDNLVWFRTTVNF